MQYKDLKGKARILGIRLTKTVKGKRVQLSPAELRKKISMNFNDTVRNAQRVIKMCKTIVVVPTTVSRSNNVVPPKPQTRPPPPPPPPPPPKPIISNGRAKLMAELKNTIKKRGLNLK